MKTATTEQFNPTVTLDSEGKASAILTPIVDGPEAPDDKDVDLGSAVQLLSAPIVTVALSTVKARRKSMEANALAWALLDSGASPRYLRAPSRKDIDG